MKKFLMGNECIALGAIEAGARAAYSYPGTPASEILSAFMELAPQRYSQWSVNEKVALELAVAHAVSGENVLCAMKQVGLNVAADPLFSSAYTGVSGALVIASADDPGPYSSQTEQDSRMYAVSAKIPVFDPSGPEDARRLAGKAVELSSKHKIPVMIRPVMRVCHSRESVEAEEIHDTGKAPEFEKNPERWAATPRFRSVLHKQLIEKLDSIALDNTIEYDKLGNTLAVISSGYPYSLAFDCFKEYGFSADLIKVDMPFPLSPDFVCDIEKSYERILILEETFPVMENQFHNKTMIDGKWNGKVPGNGELTFDIISSIIAGFTGKKISESESVSLVAPAPAIPRLCAGCAHRPAFYAIKKAFPKGIYPGDIGCYTLGTNLGAVDTVLDMGAAITFAEALKRANPEKAVIATIGDSTFFHSGIPALVNANMYDSPVVIAILDNITTAMTGFQPVPHQTEGISIEDAVKGTGVEFIESIDPYNIRGSVDLLKKAHAFAEQNSKPAVVIFRHACVTREKEKGPWKVSISDACNDCGICYDRFECPAIIKNDITGKPYIDQTGCTGCGVCAEICVRGAIVKENKDA